MNTINSSNPTPKAGTISCTNPCGEVPLLDYESCNLGSINLSKMLKSNDGVYKVDWETLAETISIYLLDF